MNPVTINADNIEYIPHDYEGISKVLSQFVELYKVCENKQLIDECLKNFCSPIFLVKGQNTYTK